MRDVAEHASWWDRELEKLWVQAGSVLGDHVAHVLIADVMRAARTGGDNAVLVGSVPWIGEPSKMRGRATTDLRRAPKVFIDDGRIAVEIPDGVGVLGARRERGSPGGGMGDL